MPAEKTRALAAWRAARQSRADAVSLKVRMPGRYGRCRGGTGDAGAGHAAQHQQQRCASLKSSPRHAITEIKSSAAPCNSPTPLCERTRACGASSCACLPFLLTVLLVNGTL
eukprot:31140-Chlamydomonas_euryale.AAC.1